MDRVIEEMAKAKGDVERELRKYIPEIIRECMAFAYLGKTFTFDVSDLSDRVNQRLISLSDAILDDIESRAKTAIKYAEEEDDEDIILPYLRRQIGDEDLVQRLDKHCSTLRYFLEGWVAIGIVNKLKEHELTNTILSYIDNPFASSLWQKALNAGYLSDAIRSGLYQYGKGNQKNILSALTEIERYTINEAYQYGCILHYRKLGAIGYRTYRQSSYPCEHCDELTMHIWSLDEIVLPAHPRCVCGSRPVFADGSTGPISPIHVKPKINKIAPTTIKENKPSAPPLVKESKPDYKSFRAQAINWANKAFVLEKLPNGDSALRLRLSVLENGDELILNKTYVEKVYSHYMANQRDLLETAMNIVISSQEWMPSLHFKEIEDGRNHAFPFRIYEGEYNGVKFELQVRMTDGFYPYLIKIK